MFLVCLCGFGEFELFLGLRFGFCWFVFCLKVKFVLFCFVVGVLKLWSCIVVRDDNTNKSINITCNGVTNAEATVYAFYKSYATITLKIDKQNGMTVYKNY